MKSRRGESHIGHCAECSEPFDTFLPQKMLCGSRGCRLARRKKVVTAKRTAERLAARANRVCGICEETFTPKNSAAKFCSDRCANRAHSIKKNFGLLPTDYRQLVASHEGRCQACGNEFTETPHIDHCHESGKVRGLLDRLCNSSLGYINDDPERAFQLAVYLERHRFDLRDLCVS